MRYLPELDGLRALAVLQVISTHAGVVALARLNGYLGVTLFFVLSGFLITSIALAEESKNGSVSLTSFYIRRTFRIFPAYYFVLLVYCVLIFGLNVSPEKQVPLRQALPYYLVYLQELPFWGALGMHLSSLPFFQSWSLGIEEKFYLAWPVVCFILLRRRPKLRIPATLLLVALCALNPLTRPYIPILFGCALALGFQIPLFRQAIERAEPWGIWVAASLLLVFQLLILPSWKQDYSNSIYAGGLFAVFLAFLVAGSNPLRRILAFSPLVFVGKVSYGIYLVHLLCIGLVRDKLHLTNTSLLFLVSAVISIAVSTVLYFAFEQPLTALGRNLSRRWNDRQAKLRESQKQRESLDAEMA
jgi:peptidoglycan/LPS O-acetylase OafA/YrhL